MTEKDSMLTVGRAAAMVGVSVRTLHHWEQIGLVVASGRTWSDYRLYDADDIARIHRVLVYRELGLPLAEIGRILDDPSVDPVRHLMRQRDLLEERIRRLTRTARAVETMIERTTMDRTNAARSTITISAEEQTRIFGADWDPAWQEEAQERWGGSAAWEESARRTRAYTAQDWQEVTEEISDLQRDLVAARRRGVLPGDPEATELAARHRESIGRHYPCTRSRQVILARMYTEDPRFTAHYDVDEPGLAEWLRSVIEVDARAHGVDPDTAAWDD